MEKWPHSPSHRFNEKGSYIITAATLHKQHIFSKPDELDLLQDELFNLAGKYELQLQAWAIFANHYHLIVQIDKTPENLRKFIKHLHANTGRMINKLQNQPGRQVWFQFWDTVITHDSSYCARLHYVMNNPVKHKLVNDAEDYPWCSINWFKHNSSRSRIETIFKYKIDQITIEDDFD